MVGGEKKRWPIDFASIDSASIAGSCKVPDLPATIPATTNFYLLSGHLGRIS